MDNRDNYLEQIKGHILEKTIVDCLQDHSSSRPHAHEIVKELEKIGQIHKKTLPCGQLAKCDPSNEFEGVSSQPHYDYKFKVIFLGSNNAGKTCLMQLLKNPAYNFGSTKATLQESFVLHSYKLNSSYLKLTIIDTVGEERFYSVPPIYLRNANGIFLVYDVSNNNTFKRLSYWMKMIQKYSPEKCKVLLVGNKVDLRKINSDEALVPQEKALRFANEFELPYMETSAKDIDSINNMLQKMVEMLISTVSVSIEDIHVQHDEIFKSTVSISSPAKQNKRKRCQCS